MPKPRIKQIQNTLTGLLLVCFLAVSAFGQSPNKKLSSGKHTQINESIASDFVITSPSSENFASAFNGPTTFDWDSCEMVFDFHGLLIARAKDFLLYNISRNTFYVYTRINAP